MNRTSCDETSSNAHLVGNHLPAAQDLRFRHEEPLTSARRSFRCKRLDSTKKYQFKVWPFQEKQETSSNKCHASSNRCLTSSNKKLLETRNNPLSSAFLRFGAPSCVPRRTPRLLQRKLPLPELPAPPSPGTAPGHGPPASGVQVIQRAHLKSHGLKRASY